ncbi:MAG: hypothetical protein Fur0022_42100 [Anaerolineales bacterium]
MTNMIQSQPLVNRHEAYYDRPLQHPILPKLLDELAVLISQLGTGGGCLTPSIYDTAQVLRFSPPREGVDLALDWLRHQQGSDGGWGNPMAPLMRDVPTLASVLALHQYNQHGQFAQQIQAGLTFLKKQSAQWEDFSTDELLVGIELILPSLVDQAMHQGLNISHKPYLKLMKIGEQKRKIIKHLKIIHGTPIAFSWEAWGELPDQYLLDKLNSVGNSPSATAAWIAKKRATSPDAHVVPSENYLEAASFATGLEIPGVVPFAWPIDRFEQSFALYALANGDLLQHPAFFDVLEKQVGNLSKAMTPYGMPFSDHFIPDLDDTAAAMVVLSKFGNEVDANILNAFKDGAGYFTYPGEFHASTSAHARAVQALSLVAPEASFIAQQVLLPFQNAEGAWPGDKWHKSWLYTTSHMLYALSTSSHLPEVEKGLRKLIMSQKEDGGWGMGVTPSTAETAYVMLALRLYKSQRPELELPYQRGKAWLLANLYRPAIPKDYLWIGKELFKPYRIDRAFELTALIQAILDA